MYHCHVQAVRNFVQLCLEGYYDGTVFHRLIRNYILQGGDASGTGTGGESVYGKPFKDEFHSRLRFTRRYSCSHIMHLANVNVYTHTGVAIPGAVSVVRGRLPAPNKTYFGLLSDLFTQFRFSSMVCACAINTHNLLA